MINRVFGTQLSVPLDIGIGRPISPHSTPAVCVPCQPEPGLLLFPVPVLLERIHPFHGEVTRPAGHRC